jgi:methyl-accepting chemotaxis protein
VLITRSITRPLQRATHIARAVAGGDLSSRITIEGRDETAELLTALRDMNQSLVQIVGQVRASSDGIATGSAQIAAGNNDLSQRTEEQASNLQQTAASMEQLSCTVKNNADTAQRANDLAGTASQAATHGREVVSQVVGTMHEIATSSRRISDILGTIDGIAFQTNILALNAAVEAARAGDQGRGFAVVAGEVRNLANRAAEAAKEIKTLIHANVERVEAGTELVNTAGESIGAIVAQVHHVSQMIGEISAASHEQSSGISQVGQAVTQLDHVTQQNAALVEESAAAAESLRHQAAQLATLVRRFHLADAAPGGAPAPHAARPAPAGRAPATASESSWESF